jgi:hypothetical protein
VARCPALVVYVAHDTLADIGGLISDGTLGFLGCLNSSGTARY